MANQCMDCGKPISRYAKRCRSCAQSANRKAAWANGAYDTPRWKKLHSEKMKGQLTDPDFQEKHREANIARRRPPNYCTDCGAEIGPDAERCSSCAAKARWVYSRKTMLSGSRDPERCQKVSDAKKRLWQDPEYAEWQSEIHSGENHYNWQGGKSFEPYGPEFNDELRQYVRDRDNHQCAVCKIPENGRAHDCHHIDGDKTNNDPANLITLCMSCHSRTNYNRRFWRTVLAPVARRREEA